MPHHPRQPNANIYHVGLHVTRVRSLYRTYSRCWASIYLISRRTRLQRGSFRTCEDITMREIVHVQAGQCGNQIGAKVIKGPTIGYLGGGWGFCLTIFHKGDGNLYLFSPQDRLYFHHDLSPFIKKLFHPNFPHEKVFPKIFIKKKNHSGRQRLGKLQLETSSS